MDGLKSGGFRLAPGVREARLERFAQAEGLVRDSVLRLSGPYVPRVTGRLAASGSAAGRQVRWNAPYAASRYYRGAGGRWFEKMKAVHGREIVQAAARLAGGRDG